MLKNCLIPILFILASFMIAPRTEANICKFWSGHQVCVVHIKRSAKYYWEYRTILSVDDKKQPEIVYNCRYFSYLQPDKTKVYFEDNDDDLGNFVCSLFNK